MDSQENSLHCPGGNFISESRLEKQSYTLGQLHYDMCTRTFIKPMVVVTYNVYCQQKRGAHAESVASISFYS